MKNYNVSDTELAMTALWDGITRAIEKLSRKHSLALLCEVAESAAYNARKSIECAVYADNGDHLEQWIDDKAEHHQRWLSDLEDVTDRRLAEDDATKH